MTSLSNRVAQALKIQPEFISVLDEFNPRLAKILNHYERSVERGYLTATTALDKVLSDYSGSNVSGQVRMDI